MKTASFCLQINLKEILFLALVPAIDAVARTATTDPTIEDENRSVIHVQRVIHVVKTRAVQHHASRDHVQDPEVTIVDLVAEVKRDNGIVS